MKIPSILLALAATAMARDADVALGTGLDLMLYAENYCHPPSIFLTCFNVQYGQCCHRRNAVSGRFAKGSSGGAHPKPFNHEVLLIYGQGAGGISPCYINFDAGAGIKCLHTLAHQHRKVTGIKVNDCLACGKKVKREEEPEEEVCETGVEATAFTHNGTTYQIADMDEDHLSWMDSFFDWD